MSEKQMVVFSIGPVQSFIASARKTEDLWSGSFILSFLIERAMETLYSQGLKVEFIYPKASEDDLNPMKKTGYNANVASWPNRFTAFVNGSLDETTNVLKKVDSVVRREFKKICHYAINEVFPKHIQTDQLLKQANHQIEQLLEVYWVVQPYKGHYREEKSTLEARLNAVKNDKIYHQLIENGFTCTVCAQRDALCMEAFDQYETIYELKNKVKNTWMQRNEKFKGTSEGKDDGRIRDNEYLCSICLGKRVARDYFKDVYRNASSFKSYPSVIEIAGKYTYFAILSMDGDNMGSWFNSNTAEEAGKVSEALATFSRHVVPEVVRKAEGYLVYAGGDDVLAFLPVDKALQVANELRQKFGMKGSGLQGATASVGLVIGHKKAPLQLLLQEAKKLENLAKSYVYKEQNQQKNALAIGVHTRSEKHETVVPWQIDGIQTSDLLNEIIELLTNDLSDTFIYRFSEVFLPLNDYDSKDKHLLVEVELRRLLRRSMKVKKEEKELTNILEKLMALYKSMESVKSFVMLLRMLTFFKRMEKQDKGGNNHEDDNA